MNLVTAKTLDQLAIAGLRIDWTKENNSVTELRLQDEAGRLIVIRASDYGSSLKTLIPKPPEEEDRWSVAGRFLDMVNVNEIFEGEYEAKERLREYERKAGGAESGLSVTKVRVQVEDGGRVVPPSTDDLPF